MSWWAKKAVLAMALAAMETSDEKVARQYLTAISGGREAEAVVLETPAMAAALDAAALKRLWAEVETSAGKFQAIDSVQIQGASQALLVRFERAALEVRVTVKDGKVAGLRYQPAEAPEAFGRRFIAALAKGEAAALEKGISAAVQGKLTPALLQQLWGQLQEKSGAFQKVEAVSAQRLGPATAVYVALQMAQGELGLHLSLDGAGLLQGVFMADPALAKGWHPAQYASEASLSETEVQVGDAPALPGTLTVPKGAKGPFPVVILVHGSGPNDRDESIGGAKVFKDLAWGLASQGVAVLRYDKRSRVSPQGIKSVKEEVLEGVSAAIALVAERPELDKGRIYVLGHSLGAYLAPWIGKDHPELAGLVLLAAPTRNLLEVERGQYDYLKSLAPKGNEAAWAARYKELDDAAAPKLAPDAVAHGAPGSYWLALRGYDPVKTAEGLKQPLLVLQGERDYQVSVTKDFPAWEALGKRKATVTTRALPGLNHLFITGEGVPRPDEYSAAGHVAPGVVQAVLAFIRK